MNGIWHDVDARETPAQQGLQSVAGLPRRAKRRPPERAPVMTKPPLQHVEQALANHQALPANDVTKPAPIAVTVQAAEDLRATLAAPEAISAGDRPVI